MDGQFYGCLVAPTPDANVDTVLGYSDYSIYWKNYYYDWGDFGMTINDMLFANVTDATVIWDPSKGRNNEMIITRNSQNEVHWYKYDVGMESWASDFTKTIYSASLPGASGNAVSALAVAPTSPVLVVTDGTPGEVWQVDPGSVGTLVGTVGDQPRRVRCAPSGTPCLVSSYGSDQLTVLLWPDPANPPTLAGTIPVGDGPVGIDVIEEGGDALVLSTGYNDNSVRLDVIDASTGNPVSSSSEVRTDCNGPGHVGFAGDGRHMVVTCNLDDNYLVDERP